MFYTAAWCVVDESSFRQYLPLELLGESIKKFGSRMGFTIVILEGIEKLSGEYLDSLRAHGFTIIDYCKDFADIIRQYPRLDKQLSRYERNCFLRWIAFKRIIEKSDAHGQFWHLDGDVVLHTSLDELAEDTKGKTFMLQGCPVLVSVSDFSWFSVYEKNLREFDENIEAYSDAANKVKDECKKNDFRLANQSLYRNPIGSDQDLLEYLISSGKIMQASASKIFDSKFYFIQNALSLNLWHEIQGGKQNQFRQTNDSRISIGSKLVPFIHYQNTFVLFAGVYLKIDMPLIPDKWRRRLIGFSIKEEKFKTNLFFKLIVKTSRLRNLLKCRNHVIKGLEKSGGISRLLNFLAGSGK